MIFRIDDYVLRPLEPADLGQLYQQKNDPEITSLLGGFSRGYSTADLESWLEYHRQLKDEILWAIIQGDDEKCIGHVGFYKIDHRIGMAEFAIMIGDRNYWGKGLGKMILAFALEFGFGELNLNRIYLSVLVNNKRAIKLYESLGFKHEGRLRQAQYKSGSFLDIILMGILREEYKIRHDA